VRWFLIALLTLLPAGAEAEELCRGLRLTDVAEEAGLRMVHVAGGQGAMHLPETMGAGVVWFDFDADGWQDLYVVQSGPFPPDGSAPPSGANRLFRNRGDGTFEDVTEGSGADDAGYGQGAVGADYDGDGRVDLYVTNYGPDLLLRNLGGGRFEDTTIAAGLGLDEWSSSGAFADADGDGDLDLYVSRYVEFDPEQAIFCGDAETGQREFCDPSLFPGATDRFYLNLGDGSFRDATDEAGMSGANGKGLGVLFTDFDADGRPDIYVANDLTINLLFHNVGGGRFEQTSLFSGAGLNRDGKAEAGMGLAVGDIDHDGDPDMVVSNFDVETNTVYVNVGPMQFEDRSAVSGFGPPSFNLLGFGVVLQDLNRDGKLDAYVTNGHIYEDPNRDSVTYEQPDLLLIGSGDGRFTSARCGSAFDLRLLGRGLAAADYDNDGDIDLALLNNDRPLQLLRSDGVEGSWLGLQLRGRPPNTEAIGSVVTLITERGRQMRWVHAGDSYQSSSERRVHFAWEENDVPLSIEIIWPDRSSTRIENPQPGLYQVVEQGGEGGAAPVSSPEGGSGTGTLAAVALGGLLAILVVAAAVVALRLRKRRSEATDGSER